MKVLLVIVFNSRVEFSLLIYVLNVLKKAKIPKYIYQFK